MPRQAAERPNQDFLGQISNLDTTDLPPGAAVLQLNVDCQIPGCLRVRKGYRELTFEN